MESIPSIPASRVRKTTKINSLPKALRGQTTPTPGRHRGCQNRVARGCLKHVESFCVAVLVQTLCLLSLSPNDLPCSCAHTFHPPTRLPPLPSTLPKVPPSSPLGQLSQNLLHRGLLCRAQLLQHAPQGAADAAQAAWTSGWDGVGRRSVWQTEENALE